MIKVTVRKAKPKFLPWEEKGKLLGNNYILIIVEVYIEEGWVDRTIISSKNEKKVISEKAIMDILLDKERPTYNYNSIDITHFAKDLENEVIYFLPLDYHLIGINKIVYYYE